MYVTKKIEVKNCAYENVTTLEIMCIFQKCVVVGVSELILRSKKGVFCRFLVIFSENHEIIMKMNVPAGGLG